MGIELQVVQPISPVTVPATEQRRQVYMASYPKIHYF